VLPPCRGWRCPLQSLCDLALRFGEDDEGEGGMSRPFGVALLVAGWDVEGGPVL
jgi:20S proteasome subunit alpha 5